MARIRVAAKECNYKDTDRQMKKQFIHGLNDSDMLEEIIRELTKKAQALVINILSEVKEFDKIQTARDDQKQNGIKLHAALETPTRKNANTVVQGTNPDDAQHMRRNAQSAT